MKTTYIIYQHINKINNLCYIGLTSNTLEYRWQGHLYSAFNRNSQYKFHQAIRFWGPNNFESKILSIENSLELAKQSEIYFISLYNSFKIGYNSTMGGDGTYERDKNWRLLKSIKMKEDIKSGKIISQFAVPETHRKSMITREENGTNIWLTNNPMKDKEKALLIASKRSGLNHYLIKYRKSYYSTDFGKSWIEIKITSTLSKALQELKFPKATFNKFVNKNQGASKGPCKDILFKIENENN